MHVFDSEDPIDAVITWVDGGDPTHRALRESYLRRQTSPLCENASNPHRWGADDEIFFCLHSINLHAPWIRTIWLVVDGEGPDPARLSPAIRAKLRLVRHHEIFAGFEHVLPTFNSLAIESMLWRIEGLSNRFLYFNDDVFLTAPLHPSDMFEGNAPVLRGKRRNYERVVTQADRRAHPARFNQVMHANAAGLLGHAPDQIFAAAHVVHPLRRSVMARLFVEHRQAFLDNIRHRFRDLGQFLPQALHNHRLIETGEVRFAVTRDHVHVKSGTSGAKAAKRLSPEGMRDAKFLCVNDLPQLEAALPDARLRLAQAVAGPSQVAQGDAFERVKEPLRILSGQRHMVDGIGLRQYGGKVALGLRP
ncbi:Stealth CR1 domain-containing protein [Sulfitobacter albidus]|uniref:Stealth CR1 domain-containing protein n=1 Tax=Sulfitobacter albidus TaxID=2829501 RepID=A0A975JDZ1_9RHOB|nr:Stealth CR1 domain-containing protein [Sulfitobacter albidus]